MWALVAFSPHARRSAGAVIVGNYRTVIQKSNLPATVEDLPQVAEGDEEMPSKDDADEDKPPAISKQQLLRAVTCSAFWAAVVAVLVVLAVGIPLGVLSRGFDETTAQIIEGVSKVVAAMCILQLSLKIPKWLGFYKSKKKGKVQDAMDMTIRGVRFNVAWNVWREVAECGIFLLPALLSGENVGAIPLSAVIGIIIGLAVGLLLYIANLRMKNTLWVAIIVTLVLVFLSTGLLVGGVHEFEEVWGETPDVYEIENPAASSSSLPLVLLKPFGYSSDRTVLQIICFWCWLALAGALHGFMMWRTKKINRELAALEATKETGDLTLHAAEKASAASSEETPSKVVDLEDAGPEQS